MDIKPREFLFQNPHLRGSDRALTDRFPKPEGCDGESTSENPDYLKLILNSRVYDVAIQTPLTKAEPLSSRVGNTILLKREDLQTLFSFKIRGAYNRMVELTPAQRERGVIACSAGNHAQGVALAAQRLGILADIVMPHTTPAIKWQSVERLGARIHMHGADFDESREECARLAKLHGRCIISAYDDVSVIAGQGTVGMEILQQIEDPTKLEAIFIASGGGGLASGVAAYVKRVCPGIKIVIVETFDAAAMTTSLLVGTIVPLSSVGPFADGAAIKRVGQEPFRVCRDLVDEMVLVDEEDVCEAIKDGFEATRMILEPAGALSLAGCKKYISAQDSMAKEGKCFVCITSGANVDWDRLPEIVSKTRRRV